jgi:hypothetical protein
LMVGQTKNASDVSSEALTDVLTESYVEHTAPEVGPAKSMAASRNDTAGVMITEHFFTGIHLLQRARRSGLGAT